MHAGRAAAIAARVEAFVRQVVVPYETDPRRDNHGGPLDTLVTELKGLARKAGVLTPHNFDGWVPSDTAGDRHRAAHDGPLAVGAPRVQYRGDR